MSGEYQSRHTVKTGTIEPCIIRRSVASALAPNSWTFILFFAFQGIGSGKYMLAHLNDMSLNAVFPLAANTPAGTEVKARLSRTVTDKGFM